jgi:lysophospholipase L1-like esterase
MTHNSSRRSFIKHTTFAALAASSYPAIASETAMQSYNWPENTTLLFQGDSITDAGRRKSSTKANDAVALGRGYACIAGAQLLAEPAGKNLAVYNRGISGNKVYQLAERWDEDCLALKPDILSVLIGVNDIWHTLVRDYEGTVETYERDYHALLERTRAALPTVKLVVCEPFVLQHGAVDDSWFPEFDRYRAAAQRVAQQAQAIFIPYQEIFNQALHHAPGEHWLRDGVHPTLAGDALMAQIWTQTVKEKLA